MEDFLMITYGLGRKFNIIEETSYWYWIFVRKFPKYFAKRSKVPFIIPYLIHELLAWHTFPMINCSQVIEKARNKEYIPHICMHVPPSRAWSPQCALRYARRLLSARGIPGCRRRANKQILTYGGLEQYLITIGWTNRLESALKSLIKIFSQCNSEFQFSMMSDLHQLFRNK